ncbi:MAG: hypothetical protein ACLPQS_11915 [Acidimicrobiales bacterium]
MNFVAHSHVALLCDGDGWEQAFGAALPDLASMAGTRIDRSLLSPAVEAGVVLHHRADKAFHALETFRTGSGKIRDGLLAAGLSTGPARAVGHAGYELVLDGCLLTRAGLEDEFAEVLARAPDVTAAVSSAERGGWRALFAAMRDDRWWLGYREPHMVARAMHRRLGSRPRLRFSGTELSAVTSVLTGAIPVVDAVTDDIIAAVTEGIR